MNSILYTRALLLSQEATDNDPGDSDSEVMIPALEEDSWWYSDSQAPDSKYVGSVY